MRREGGSEATFWALWVGSSSVSTLIFRRTSTMDLDFLGRKSVMKYT
jgi:hypothetical protein